MQEGKENAGLGLIKYMGKCYFFCNHKELKLVDKDLGVRESERERLSCSFLICFGPRK